MWGGGGEGGRGGMEEEEDTRKRHEEGGYVSNYDIVGVSRQEHLCSHQLNLRPIVFIEN